MTVGMSTDKYLLRCSGNLNTHETAPLAHFALLCYTIPHRPIPPNTASMPYVSQYSLHDKTPNTKNANTHPHPISSHSRFLHPTPREYSFPTTTSFTDQPMKNPPPTYSHVYKFPNPISYIHRISKEENGHRARYLCTLLLRNYSQTGERRNPTVEYSPYKQLTQSQ